MFEFNATFLVAMISFVVFIVIMNAILYKPILSVIEERKKYIDANNNSATESKNKIQNILDDKEKRLNEASIQAKKIISDRVEKENNNALNITEKAKAESIADITSAKDELSKEANETKEILKSNIKDLAENISYKILGENFVIENVDNEMIDKVLK